MGSYAGIVIPLVISLFFIIPQIRKREFNLMDVTSVLYFSIASAATFIFKLNMFVEHSGFIGYFVLFLMALISLVIKRPFTFQVSKKDYPKIYWKDKSFLAINSQITIVWAGIFLSNAILFLLLAKPFTVVLSNILIVIGIIFSIVFPLKAPAYFVSEEFKKYDWRVM